MNVAFYCWGQAKVVHDYYYYYEWCTHDVTESSSTGMHLVTSIQCVLLFVQIYYTPPIYKDLNENFKWKSETVSFLSATTSAYRFIVQSIFRAEYFDWLLWCLLSLLVFYFIEWKCIKYKLSYNSIRLLHIR